MNAVSAGLVFFITTFAATFGSYALMRTAFKSHIGPDTRSIAETTMFRIAALHGLILALVFAQELSNIYTLKSTVDREANGLGSIVRNLDRYDSSGGSDSRTTQIKTDIARYVRATIDTEWKALDETRRLSASVDAVWDSIYQSLLDLPANGSAQTWLRDRMLTSIEAVGVERKTREIAAASDINPIFWVVAFGGIISLAVCFFAYEPTRTTIALLMVYTFYSALVLFIIKLSDFPFSTPGLVPPTSLEILYDELLRPIVEPPSR
ncbi:MAG: hypothetical protein AAGD34_14090 [Pseudomonadota bacterium]